MYCKPCLSFFAVVKQWKDRGKSIDKIALVSDNDNCYQLNTYILGRQEI